MDIYDRIIYLCKKYKTAGEYSVYDLVKNDIYNEYGKLYSVDSIRGISRRYREKNNLDEMFTPKDSVKQNEKQLDEKNILESNGYDSDKFTLVSARQSKWSNGKNNTSMRITVKPKNEFKWTQEIIDKILDGICIEPNKDVYVQSNYEKNGKALILPIVDLHYAMYANNNSTDNIYNDWLANDIFNYVIDDILLRTKNYKFEKIYFTIGNDIINCDNRQGTTTKGTPQSNTIEVEDAVIKVTNMLMKAIDRLKKITDVDVIHINGNHDYIVSFGIANALRARYIDDHHVNVDCSYIDRKYRVFGKTLIGFAHNINTQKVNDIVQSDARKLIADTTRTIYLLAHLHHEECIDIGGTDVRRLPTVSGKSRWTYEKGYNSIRKCQSFILDSEFGITDILYTIIK